MKVFLPMLVVVLAAVAHANAPPKSGPVTKRVVVKKPVSSSPKTSSPSPVAKEIDLDEFQEECLERHNFYRAKHGVNPLKLNDELSAYAQEWANKLARSLKMVHRQSSKYGENLYMHMTTNRSHEVTGDDAVDNWYIKELPLFTFGKEPTNLDAGHLTQVLWADSEELGVGVAKNGYYTFVVCNYDPPGNFLGEFVENCPPVGGLKAKDGVAKSPSKSTAKNGDAKTPSKSEPKDISTDMSDEEFAKEMLRIHNEYRAKHGVPALTLDSTISKYAQDWADHLAVTNKLKHRTEDDPYGENLFWSSARATPQKACDSWYSEIKDYKNYKVDPFKTGTPFKSGHYTQMVWKGSQKLGIGKAINKSGAMIVVANYYPQGNYIGQFTTNVLPPTK